jgi:ferredoxin
VKSLIVYFSGTGTTAWCARRLREHLSGTGKDGETILHALEGPGRNDHAHVNGVQRLILLYPLHAGDAPKPVREWVRQLPKPPAPAAGGGGEGKPLTAVFSVSGGGAIWPNNDGRRRVIRDLGRRGYPVSYEDMLVMPSNWTVETPGELVPLLHRATDNRLRRAAEDLQRRIAKLSPAAPASAMVSWMASLEHRFSPRFGRGITPDENCNGCGWCAANCPAGNISMGAHGKPEFADVCLICMRCLYGCPKGSLSPSWLKFFRIPGGFEMPQSAGRALEAGALGDWDAGDKKTRELIDSAARGILWLGLRRYLYRWLSAAPGA